MKKLMLIALFWIGSTLALADDITAGGSLYKTKGCIGCHGPAGKSVNPEAFPVLAGREPAYTVEQIMAFKKYTRMNPMMNGIVAGLSEEEIASIAAYLAAQK